MINKLKNGLILIWLLYSIPLYSQSNYNMDESYTFLIQGSSNIRDWMEFVEEVDGVANIIRLDSMHFDIHEVKILIRVNSIKSMGVEGTAMNKKTYETLKADQYPVINFMILSPVRPVVVIGKKHFIETKGLLTVAGITKTIRLHPTILITKEGKVSVEGHVFLKISDFGIDPPVTLFGLLRVKDEVFVHFNVNLVPVPN